MAITKIYVIRSQLEKTVAYAANEDKTALDDKISYSTNPEKTEERLFERAINCTSVAQAADEMNCTKERFQKTNGILGYHIIQSFKPDEITPEMTHQIGVEFAQRLFGDRFEIVVGTHLDKNHLHNHIVINSVSFVDGKKLRCNMSTYFNEIQKVSDDLCREYNLSTITPKTKGKNHAEWSAEKQGAPTIRGQIRADIDGIIAQSFTYPMFLEGLRKSGYQIKSGNVKHVAIKPPYSKRYIRLDSLGKEYTEEAITERIANLQRWDKRLPPQKPTRRRVKGNLSKRPKITGFRALYFRYVYLLRGRKKGKQVSRYLLDEKVKFNRYLAQHTFLMQNNINTTDDLQMVMHHLETQIQSEVDHRFPLYEERKHTNDQNQKATLSQQIATHTSQIKSLRQQLRLCKQIDTDRVKIQEKLKDAHRIEQQAAQTRQQQNPQKRR